MADVDSISQYYNLYDSSKGYTEMLFRAGKVLQSKEVNELQSILKEQIQNVGNTILSDGDIVEGCQLVIDSETGKKATVTAGKIYLQGNVRNVASTTLTITGTGTETIGIKLTREVVTPDEDPDLLDVATGYDNYNQDGAYRLRENAILVLNDDSAITVFTIQDGQQVAQNTNEDLTQIERIQNTLARRTFDESGNYKVEGLDLATKSYYDSDYIYVNLEPGRAYIQGYEVTKTAAQNIGIPRATDTRNVQSEPKVFTSGTLRYALNNRFPDSISRVIATVEVTETKTRSSVAGGTDSLNNGSVVSVQSVVQGSTTYIAGTDYQLTDDGIDWSLSGAEPSSGSTYTVTYRYNSNLAEGTDFTLSYSSESTVGYILFTNSGAKPVNGTTFLVDYDYLLCRIDVVSLDKDGMIIVTSGQSNTLLNVESPAVDSNDVLPIGSVLVIPKSDQVTVVNNETKAVHMLDLYNMLARINTLEYNQAVTQLDNEAASGESSTSLVGVFTDGFVNFDKADIFHSEWDASIDDDNETLTLPYSETAIQLVPNTASNYSAAQFDTLITSEYSEVVLMSQPMASSAMRINSYSAFPKSPTVKLTPNRDNWVNETSVTSGQTYQTVSLRRWWYHRNDSWAASEKALWQSYGFADGGESLGRSNTTTTTYKSETTRTIEPYMRENTVTVEAWNLAANVDNIIATFDGKRVALSPSTAAYTGTTSGTLKASSAGYTKGTFRIPANTLAGTRELRLWASSTPSLYGTADYTADVTNVRTTVYPIQITIKTTDPIAQSFSFDTDQTVTAIGIYLKDKDANEPLIVQVRNMINGYPGTTVYASKTLNGSDCKTSSAATAETKVVFDDPVKCDANTQYCVTILSNSSTDSIWYGALNEKTTTGSSIEVNPYLSGVMFSSSNNFTWTAHQNSDLKMSIYGARFNTSGSVTFNQIALPTRADRILVTADEDIPAGCTIYWQYSTDGGTTWVPIEAFSDKELDTAATRVTLRAQWTSMRNVSPAISTSSLMLGSFTNKLQSTYISRNVNVAAGFNDVKVAVNLYVPTGSSITVYYATDTNGTSWTAMTAQGTPTQVTNLYKEYIFENKLSSTAKNFRCKLVLTTSSQTTRPTAKALKCILKTV